MLPLNQILTNIKTDSTSLQNGQTNMTDSEALDLDRFKLARVSPLMKDLNTRLFIAEIMGGAMKLGLKGDKLPTEAELAIMHKSVTEEYPNIKIGEITLAFDLAAKGKLDVEVETYQNFSMLYLHRILRAFARYGMSKLNEIKPERSSKWNPEPIPDDEKIDICFDSYKRFGQWDCMVFQLQVFNILHKRGEIIVSPTKTLQKVRKMMQDQMITGSSRKKNEIAQQLNDDDYIENQCRRMAVADYFDLKIKAKKVGN